jgi:hypothetical protein
MTSSRWGRTLHPGSAETRPAERAQTLRARAPHETRAEACASAREQEDRLSRAALAAPVLTRLWAPLFDPAGGRFVTAGPVRT